MKTTTLSLVVAAAWAAAGVPHALAAEGSAPEVQSAPAAEDATWPRICSLIESKADKAAWEALCKELYSTAEGSTDDTLHAALSFMLDACTYGCDPHNLLIIALRTQYGDVAYLLEHGAKETLNEVYPDSYIGRCSPLFWAIADHRFGECEGTVYYPYVSKCTPFHLQAAELLLAAGADPHQATGPLGMTPLMVAVRSNNYRAKNLLLKAGADVHRKDSEGNTALSWAVEGHSSYADELIRRGAAVNGITCHSPHLGRAIPLLHMAVATLQPSKVRLLLDSGADPHARDAEGKLPLDYLSDELVTNALSLSDEEKAKNRKEIQRLLDEEKMKENQQRHFLNALDNECGDIEAFIARGVDVNGVLIGCYGECLTPLFFAAANHRFGECEGEDGPSHCSATEFNTRMIRRLLELGADPNLPSGRWLLRTPLMVAAASGSLENVKLLVEGGARVNQGDFQGATAISYALAAGHVDVARYLISQGADVNVYSLDFNKHFNSGGGTLLHDAANRCNADEVQMLLDAGADPLARDHRGWTPLHWLAMDAPDSGPIYHTYQKTATPQERIRTAQAFTKAADKPRPVNTAAQAARPQLTPLMAAAYAGDIPAMERLLAAGAAVDEKDADGATALSWAVAGGRADAVRLLLSCRASVHVPAADMYYRAQALRFNLLHFAAMQRREDIIALLFSADSPPREDEKVAKDAYGLTPGAWLFDCEKWVTTPPGAPYFDLSLHSESEHTMRERLLKLLPANTTKRSPSH